MNRTFIRFASYLLVPLLVSEHTVSAIQLGTGSINSASARDMSTERQLHSQAVVPPEAWFFNRGAFNPKNFHAVFGSTGPCIRPAVLRHVLDDLSEIKKYFRHAWTRSQLIDFLKANPERYPQFESSNPNVSAFVVPLGEKKYVVVIAGKDAKGTLHSDLGGEAAFRAALGWDADNPETEIQTTRARTGQSFVTRRTGAHIRANIPVKVDNIHIQELASGDPHANGETHPHLAMGPASYRERTPGEIIRLIFEELEGDSSDLSDYLARLVKEPNLLAQALDALATYTRGSKKNAHMAVEAIRSLISQDENTANLLDSLRYTISTVESRFRAAQLIEAARHPPLSMFDPGYATVAHKFVEKFHTHKADRQDTSRPFILAVKAAPAAGKTTLVQALRLALEGEGVRVVIVDERQFLGRHPTFRDLVVGHPGVDVILFETVTDLPPDHRLLDMYVELKADAGIRQERIVLKTGSLEFAQERASIVPAKNYSDRPPDVVIDNTIAGAALYTDEEIAEQMSPAFRPLAATSDGASEHDGENRSLPGAA